MSKRIRSDRDPALNSAAMRNRAEDDPSREIEALQYKPAMRRCMCGCRQNFLSSWPGERFLPRHRLTARERDTPLHWDGLPFGIQEINR